MVETQESTAMAQTIVILKRAHFFSMDNDIIDVHAKRIGGLGVAIYAVLARFANRKTGECWPAIARIQRTLNLGRSTVKRYLHLLEKEGLITVSERYSEEGDRTSNLYTLLNPEPSAIAHRQQTPDAPPSSLAPDVLEGGGSAENPPPGLCEGQGGSAENPQEPQHQNQKQETTNEPASPEKTPRQHTCTHPAPELSTLADITICYHCWSILEEQNKGDDHGENNHHRDPADTSQAA
jgi:DNA-binding MarR family transcriptional regulator